MSLVQSTSPPPSVGIVLNAVIVAVTRDAPRILTVGKIGPDDETGLDALPSGPFDPSLDRTLDRGVRRWVSELTGQDLGYVEQLYTFGDRNRDPSETNKGVRVVAVAYLALVREGAVSGIGDARWRNCYDFFPWEDWRQGRPAIIEEKLTNVLTD
jgi:hypothetical protein